ncbi:MAG: helix-turn-helix domain-containing protein [Halodesulfurarchaeum sp.]
MSPSIREHLEADMECEGLLDCFHGLKPLDRDPVGVLLDAEKPLTVDELVRAVDRERSTAYRSVQRLLEAGLVEQDQVTYDQGGYHHVFYLTDTDAVVEQLQRMLNDWYAEMGQLKVVQRGNPPLQSRSDAKRKADSR